MHTHPYVAAELNRWRRADLLAAAGNYRRARALRQQGRHLLRARLAAGASALRDQWGGLQFRQLTGRHGRATTQ